LGKHFWQALLASACQGSKWIVFRSSQNRSSQACFGCPDPRTPAWTAIGSRQSEGDAGLGPSQEHADISCEGWPEAPCKRGQLRPAYSSDPAESTRASSTTAPQTPTSNGLHDGHRPSPNGRTREIRRAYNAHTTGTSPIVTETTDRRCIVPTAAPGHRAQGPMFKLSRSACRDFDLRHEIPAILTRRLACDRR
jgi:hypothetical protein